MKKFTMMWLAWVFLFSSMTMGMTRVAPAEIVLDATELEQAFDDQSLTSILQELFSPEEFSSISTAVTTPEFFEADLEIAIADKDFPKFQLLVESARNYNKKQKIAWNPLSEGAVTSYIFKKLNKDIAIKERFDNLVEFYETKWVLPTSEEVTLLWKEKRAENWLSIRQEGIVYSVVKNVNDVSISTALDKIEAAFDIYQNSGMEEDQLSLIFGLIEWIREVAETVYGEVDMTVVDTPSYEVCDVMYDGAEKYQEYLKAFYATNAGQDCDGAISPNTWTDLYTVCGKTYDGDKKYRQYLRAYKMTKWGTMCDGHDSSTDESELYFLCWAQYNGTDKYQDYLDRYKETRGGKYCDGVPTEVTDNSQYTVCSVTYNWTDMYKEYKDAYYSTNGGKNCDGDIVDQWPSYIVCDVSYNGSDMYNEYLSAYRKTNWGQNCEWGGNDTWLWWDTAPTWTHCEVPYHSYSAYLSAFDLMPVCEKNTVDSDLVVCSYDDHLGWDCTYQAYISCFYDESCKAESQWKPSKGNGNTDMPNDCSVWNDGCNTCSRTDAGAIVCTKMACVKQGTPYCKDDAPTITCANVRCGSDTECIMNWDGPTCVPRLWLPTENLAEKAACLDTWGTRSMNMMWWYTCYEATSDIWKRCTDSSECEKACVVKFGDDDATSWTCWSFTWGCMSQIVDGSIISICE